MLRIVACWLAMAVLAFVWLHSAGPAFAQGRPAGDSAQQGSSQEDRSRQGGEAEKASTQGAHQHKGLGGELAEETRESTGADAEENANLKHSAMVRLLARVTGLSVHAAHILALVLNFAVIVAVVVWASRKYLPAVFRHRSEAIQQALQEARAASEDANRRLTAIEDRLRQLDVEVERMQSAAEREARAEEERIEKAAQEDIRKVVQAAEQEIAAAAKQARRELSTHTADLAIALAHSQIHVDANTDQVLVRTFASQLSAPDGSRAGENGGKGES